MTDITPQNLTRIKTVLRECTYKEGWLLTVGIDTRCRPFIQFEVDDKCARIARRKANLNLRKDALK